MLFVIRRLLLLGLIIMVAYCFWPRKPDLLKFKPEEIAELQEKSWQQAKKKQWFSHMVTNFRIYNGQYKIPPFAAAGVAFDATRATSLFSDAIDDTNRDAATKALRNAYEIIKKETKKSFNAESVASLEISVWGIPKESANQKPLAQAISDQLAMIYGGKSEKYAQCAGHFAKAMILSQSAEEASVREDLKMAWSDLRDAASTE